VGSFDLLTGRRGLEYLTGGVSDPTEENLGPAAREVPRHRRSTTGALPSSSTRPRSTTLSARRPVGKIRARQHRPMPWLHHGDAVPQAFHAHAVLVQGGEAARGRGNIGALGGGEPCGFIRITN